MTLEDRFPPQNLEAEEAVLGSLLLEPDLIHSLMLGPEDFYHEVNAMIFKAMVELKAKGSGINQITVAQQLNDYDKLEDIGGAAFLSTLISNSPTPIDCHHYAEIVKKMSTFRLMIVAADKIAKDGYDASKSITDVLSSADKSLLELRKDAGTSNIISPDERVRILYDRYEKLYTLEKGVAISTGLLDLDWRLGGGLFPGDLLVIGARPGVGKTTMLECISNHVALNDNVLFCSGEMNIEGLSDRDVAGEIGIGVDEIRIGHYDEDVYQDIIDKGLPYLSKLKVYHLDASRTFQFNTANIYQAAYEMQVRHGLALVIIDYLGQLTDKYGNNNNDRLGFITRNLKQMALNLNVPVFCAHQLSRAVESREEKRPQLHDLRDSGNIEQDADVVLFLYRESYYGKEDNNITEILGAKVRQGKSGWRVKVLFDDKHGRYVNLAKDKQEE